MLQEFFLTVKAMTRGTTGSGEMMDSFRKWGPQELQLHNRFAQAREDVHVALCGQYITHMR